MYHGDIRLGNTIDIKFTTRTTAGVPSTLGGTPVVSAYVGNGTTQITAGITLTVDFDAVTGLNNVRVVATSGNGFATASDVELVITTGTVNAVSVVGEVIGSFSIENRSALMPTTAARTLDVASTGEAGLDFDNTTVLTGAYPFINIAESGTAQSATATTLVMRAGASSVNSNFIGSILWAKGSTQGYWQWAVVTASTEVDDTLTIVSWSGGVTPSGTILYVVWGIPQQPSTLPVPAQLANTTHGGSATTITARRVVVANTTNAETAVDISASGTGNAHALNILATGGGKGVAIGAASVGVSVDSSAADAITVQGGTNSDGLQIAGNGTGVDIRANTTGSITGNLSGSVGSVGAGGIAAASFAANAIDNSALAASAANEIADALLLRNIAGGSSAGRLVSEALAVLRNKTAIAAGTLTVYATDDVTPLFTAAVTTTAGDPISAIDPA